MARIKIEFPEPTLFTHELSVRVTDLNYGNHLAHDSLISLLHEARAQFFIAHQMSELDIDGAGIIMADIAVCYRAEANFGQKLLIDISVAELGTKSCDMYYRVRCKVSDQHIATGKTGLVFFDYAAKKPVGVPSSFLEIVRNC